MAGEKSCGFAIAVQGERMVESTAKDFVEEHGVPKEYQSLVKADGTITSAGWKRLNDDLKTIEKNALAWLKKKFLRVRDEGHSAVDDLVGTLWYDPSNHDQMDLLELASDAGRGERIDFKDSSYGGMGDDVAYKGVDDFGYQLLDGCIVFFDVDEEF